MIFTEASPSGPLHPWYPYKTPVMTEKSFHWNLAICRRNKPSITIDYVSIIMSMPTHALFSFPLCNPCFPMIACIKEVVKLQHRTLSLHESYVQNKSSCFCVVRAGWYQQIKTGTIWSENEDKLKHECCGKSCPWFYANLNFSDLISFTI